MIMTKRTFSRRVFDIAWVDDKGAEMKYADYNPIHGALNAIEREGATIGQGSCASEGLSAHNSFALHHYNLSCKVTVHVSMLLNSGFQRCYR